MPVEIKPKIWALQLNEKYAKFAIEPLEPGFGHTLGNAFRRTLIAHIEGAAISYIRFEGALHEFSKLDGVMEDTTQIMLNIREIAIRADEDAVPEDEEVVMTIEAQGAGKIYAADISAPAGVEIVNPDLYIAELTSDDAELTIEMWVERGTGYKMSNEKERGVHGVDVLPIDSVFSPIHRANYRVEPTRLGSRTDLDRLVLELWGDGSVVPEDALEMAAARLRRNIDVFIDVAEELEGEQEEEEVEEELASRHLDIPIEDVDFSVRTFNCLKKENINTLGELIQRTEDELLAIRNFGNKSLEEVIEKLQQYELQLADAGEE
ncbi:MAG: DNA-directed RNA polymerase subunit alpha [Armatimonadota bacterium]